MRASILKIACARYARGTRVRARLLGRDALTCCRALNPSQFTRLAIEVEGIAQGPRGSRRRVTPPGGELNAETLTVLIGSLRLRGLVETYMADPTTAQPPAPQAQPISHKESKGVGQ